MAIVFQKPKALTDAVLHYCPGCTHGIVHRLVAEAKREEQIERGETPEYRPDIESYRGKFAKNLRKADPDRRRLHPGVAIAIIVVLLILWHYLLTGSFSF